jgi:ABC-type transport system involved in cytochrome bd biosynthesis fused ATPase/permease subunit
MVENVMKSLIGGLPLTTGRLDAAALQTTRFQGFCTVSKPVAIVFDSLGLKLTSGKVVLEGVTGMFQQAHLIAIMGPSGCGKVKSPTTPSLYLCHRRA